MLQETCEKCSTLFKFKEDENLNRRNTLSILRIKLKLHFVQNVESDAEIGQNGTFCKGLYNNMNIIYNINQTQNTCNGKRVIVNEIAIDQNNRS